MASDAQIRANQLNARQSCGPRTDEGKGRARGNALKHGLAGQGIVLPEEERGRFAGRLGTWAEELDARGDLECFLVARAALASVRLDRCTRVETAALEGRQGWARHDCAADQRSRDAVAAHAHALAHDPAGALSKLGATAAGCQWLRAEWAGLRAALADRGHWDEAELDRARLLLGLPRPPAAVAEPAAAALWRAALEARPPSWPAEVARDPGRPRPPEAARDALLGHVDAMIARLDARRDALWAEVDAPALAHAEALASFDDTPAATLLRRYEDGASRELHRSLQQLRAHRRDLASAPREPNPMSRDPTPDAPPAAIPANPPGRPGTDGTPADTPPQVRLRPTLDTVPSHDFRGVRRADLAPQGPHRGPHEGKRREASEPGDRGAGAARPPRSAGDPTPSPTPRPGPLPREAGAGRGESATGEIPPSGGGHGDRGSAVADAGDPVAALGPAVVLAPSTSNREGGERISRDPSPGGPAIPRISPRNEPNFRPPDASRARRSARLRRALAGAGKSP